MDRRALFPFSLSPTPSNSSILSPGSTPLSPPSLSRFVYPWKAPPCRRAQCEWPRPLCHHGFMHLSIPIYPFAQEQCFLFPWINVHRPGRMMRAVSKPSRFPALRIDAGIRIRFSITRSSEIMTPLRISLYTSWSGEDLYIYSNFWIYNICFRYISTLALTNFYFCSIVTNVYHSYLGV